MNLAALVRWQWEGYSRYHRSRGNLLLHIVAVPLFLLASVALLASLARQAWLAAAVATILVVVSLALQGRGHRLEPTPPEPFAGPLDALQRILCEQCVTFPRFVLAGGWLEALRRATSP